MTLSSLRPYCDSILVLDTETSGLSCRMAELDKFTLDLISNEEIIAVMTDYPAKMPEFKERSGVLVGVRTLSDGRKATGYFNLSDEGKEIDGIYLPPHFAKLKVTSF